MSLSFFKRENTLIVKLSGDIDHHNAESVRNKIEREFQKGNMINLILDYEGVSFMDSSGIGMVIGRYKQVTAVGGYVCVINLSEDVERIFKLSGLFKIINKYDSLGDALKFVGQAGVYNG